MEESSKELACSGRWYKLINEAMVGQPLTFPEFQVLRDAADTRLDTLIRRYHGRREFGLVQESVKLAAQTLQASCLSLRVATISPRERQDIKDAFDYQLVYLQACLNRCFDQV
ncbi:hypothetical protein [Pseudomonas sp. R5(2019)]|uniref:hypothetical protein n=1 Tax=Pseudomonas sp. R5(2019) TaxID=2697566 RepID=UPI001412D15B|nr:hypothetical protein [Pseudomonas sp. R5(2019)]NBA97339.1 hypothetical protein [Pseudomonas sp. R5(2019)]